LAAVKPGPDFGPAKARACVTATAGTRTKAPSAGQALGAFPASG